MEPKELHIGDVCPNCGSAFVEVPAPTDEQRAAAARQDDPMPLPPQLDTAPAHVRDELGALYRCSGCPYKARLRPANGAENGDGEGRPAKRRSR